MATTMTMMATMTATNHDDQLGVINPTMLIELNCTFGISFLRCHCCDSHGHSLWPSWFVAIMACGHYGIGPYDLVFLLVKQMSVLIAAAVCVWYLCCGDDF